MRGMRCAACGAAALEERHGAFVFEWPQGASVSASTFDDATWLVCSECDEEELPPELVARIEAERYRLDGLLSPEALKEVRARVGLSQRDMAKLLGVGEKTYTRWELGLSTQTKSMDNLVRLADQHPAILLEIEARRRPDRDREVRDYVADLPATKAAAAHALAAHGGALDDNQAETLRTRLLELAGREAHTR